ncbi:hypothetical protein T10_6287 [Trichinella papuae]|uniref:Uncharacterized protein n=1 Tax=Trichinella papuae TaxID=268474 RepID=A0A0V1MXJ0_9BILA|nr:hypothetical protein T10_6287 [Trichinella papuae]
METIVNLSKCICIIEALLAVILNQTRNSRYSLYYLILFALYSLKLQAEFNNGVDSIFQYYIQKPPGLLCVIF